MTNEKIALLVLAACACGVPGFGLAQESRIYRCGNEYTNDAASAVTRGCRVLEGGNVTIIQGRPPAGAAAVPAAAARPAPGGLQIDSSVQRSRDRQAHQILTAELEKSRQRLQELEAEYQDGEPARLGSERNYQRYLDRVAQLKTDIERTRSDIDGIQREIARLGD